jgi:hypothetical protein
VQSVAFVRASVLVVENKNVREKVLILQSKELKPLNAYEEDFYLTFIVCCFADALSTGLAG